MFRVSSENTKRDLNLAVGKLMFKNNEFRRTVDVRKTSGSASVSPQTCDKTNMRCLEMNFCKSEKLLRVHVFLILFQDVKKNVILRW